MQGAFDFRNQEDDETKASRVAFDKCVEEMLNRYRLDRKKAKVVFRNDASTYAKLELNKSVPQSYVGQLKAIKSFYEKLGADKTLQTKLVAMKITAASIKAGSDAVTEVANSRALYLKEVGESQNATKSKDKALDELEDWMKTFYDVAEIALEDQPQLLESLGVFIRS